MRKEFERAAAEAFTGMTAHQSACYHYADHGHADTHRQILAIHYHNVMLKKYPDVKSAHILSCISVALSEMTYPTINKSNYSWTGRQRAASANIPQSTWQRNKLCQYVEFIINDIRSNAHSVWHNIESNIKGRSSYLD